MKNGWTCKRMMAASAAPLGFFVVSVLGAGAASAQDGSGAVFQALANVNAAGVGSSACGALGNQAVAGSGNRLTDSLNTFQGTTGFDDESVPVGQRRVAYRYCDSLSPVTAGGWTGNGGLDPGATQAQANAFAPEEIFAGMDNAIATFDIQTANVSKRLSLVRLARRRDRKAAEAFAARSDLRERAYAANGELDPSRGYAAETGFARETKADRGQRVLLAMQEGINAGDGTESGLGFFLNGRVNIVKGEESAAERGSEGIGGGFTLGVDSAIGDSLFGGIALGYTRIGTDFDNSGSDSDLDAVTVTAYAAAYPMDDFYIDGSVSASYLGFEQSNELLILDGGPQPGALEGDADGANFGIDLGMGYAISLGDGNSAVDGLTIEPFVRTSFLYTNIDEFDLEGGDGTLDLSIEEQETISVTASVGFRTEYAISTQNGIVTPYVRAAYVREFNNENDDLEIGLKALPGPTAKLQAEATDSNYGNFGAGVAATLGQGLSQFVDYDVVAGHDNVTIHQVTAGLRLEF